MSHRSQGVAEEEARALDGAEEVARHQEAAALDAGEQQGGAARLVDAPVDLRGLQVRVDFLLDPDELPRPPQVGQALPKTAVAHLAPSLAPKPRGCNPGACTCCRAAAA